VGFRGFHGRYKLTVEAEEIKKAAAFVLRPGEPVRLTVTLPGNEGK
jgi:hypothetical protein